MNWFKVNKYLQELFEVFWMIVYCLLELIGILFAGLFIAGVVTYYAFMGNWGEIKVMQVMYSCLSILVIIAYKLYTKFLEKMLINLQETAIYISIVGHLIIIPAICDFYYADNPWSVYEILMIIGIMIIYYYFVKDCKKLLRSRMLEVG